MGNFSFFHCNGIYIASIHWLVLHESAERTGYRPIESTGIDVKSISTKEYKKKSRELIAKMFQAFKLSKNPIPIGVSIGQLPLQRRLIF